MLGRRTTNRTILISGMVLLFLSIVTLQGNCVYVAHEDPGNAVSINKMDEEVMLMAHVQDMVYRAFMITYNLNTSRYESSSSFLNDYGDVYQNYHTMVEYSSITESVYNNIDWRMGVIKNDLGTLIYDSRGFDDEYSNFTRYKSSGDIVNATRSAIAVRNHYRNLSSANTSYTSNGAAIIDMLNETIVYTYPLNFSYRMVNWTMLGYTINETDVDELLSHTVLTLAAGQTEASVGSRIAFDVRLKTDNPVPVAGQKVTLYVNDRASGQGYLGANGSCTIFYTPDDWDSLLTAYVDLVPDDTRLVPVTSEPLEIRVLERPTTLSINVWPTTVSCGDTVRVSGALTASDGTGVSGRDVGISLKNRYIGTAKTASDGTYAFAYPVTYETPAGLSVLAARFEGTEGNIDVNLPSESAPVTLDVTVQGTGLTLNSRDLDLIGGDVAGFYGKLTAEDGTPVKAAMINLYDGDRILGRNATDGNGTYLIQLTVPLDIGNGTHSLHATFPASGQSLEAATSNSLSVAFGDVRPHIVGSTVPRVLFDGDTMSLQGYLLTQNDMPMAGQNLTVDLPDGTSVTLTTSAKGRYEYLHRVSYKDRVGQYGIYVVSPGYAYFAGETVVLPYNKLAMVMGALIIPPTALYLLVKITRFDRFVSRRMKRRASAARRKRPARTPAPGVTAPEPPAPAPVLDLERELAALKAMIAEGRLKDALISAYAVTRRIAEHYGNEVRDSSTHREFYWQVASKYAVASQPLSAIINKYESVNYGQGAVNVDDVDVAMDSLRNVYQAMGPQGGEEHRP